MAFKYFLVRDLPPPRLYWMVSSGYSGSALAPPLAANVDLPPAAFPKHRYLLHTEPGGPHCGERIAVTVLFRAPPNTLATLLLDSAHPDSHTCVGPERDRHEPAATLLLAIFLIARVDRTKHFGMFLVAAMPHRERQIVRPDE